MAVQTSSEVVKRRVDNKQKHMVAASALLEQRKRGKV